MAATTISMTPSQGSSLSAAITAVPVDGDPGAGSGPKASITGVADPGKLGKPRLCSAYKGVYVELPFDERHVDNKTKELWKKTESTMSRIWDKAAAKLPKDAISLTVNYSQFYISYKVVNDDGELEIRRLPLDDFRDDMLEVREAGKKLWMRTYHGSGPDDDANRSVTGERPFEKSTNFWERNHPNGIEAFATEPHLGALWGELKGDQKSDALRRIIAAESFMREMGQKIHDLLIKAEEENKPENLLAVPADEKARKQKALSDLSNLDKKMKDLDRYPIYWAAALCGNTPPSELDKKERYQIADRITNGIQRALSVNVKDDSRSRPRQLLDKVTFSGETKKLLAVGPFLRAYALDAGDLVIHDRLEHIDRTEMTNKGEDRRALRTVSMEEFITFNIAHLPQDDFDAGKALDSFGLKLDAQTRTSLVDEVGKTREKIKREMSQFDDVSSWEKASKYLK